MVAGLQELLTAMVEGGASDLHLSCATYPQIRLNGTLEPLVLGRFALADDFSGGPKEVDQLAVHPREENSRPFPRI